VSKKNEVLCYHNVPSCQFCKPILLSESAGAMRTFASGATRDSEDGKMDYEGFLSPLVLQRFAEYMHKHREQADGTLRSSDNWQKGMDRDVYMKSLFRHFVDLWLLHRGLRSAAVNPDIEDALCACLFNIQGYLFEVITG
jgi:hypothetical protein